MKKLTALLLVLLLSLSLFACGKAEPTAEAGGQTAGGGETAEATLTSEPTPTPAVPLEALPVPESYSSIALEHVKDIDLDILTQSNQTLLGIYGKNLAYIDATVPVSITWDYGPEAESRGVVDGKVKPASLLSLESGKVLTGYDEFMLCSEQYGLIGFRTFKEDVNRWGLLDADMNVIMEDSAAWIWKLSDRFLQMFFAAGVTQNPEEAMFGYTAGMYTNVVGLMQRSCFADPMVGGTDVILYTGTCRVYDCEKQAFVPGVEWSEQSVRCLANNQIVYMRGKFYDAAGTQVFAMGSLPDSDLYVDVMTDEYIMLGSTKYGQNTVYVFDGAMNPKGSLDIGYQDRVTYETERYVPMVDYYQKVSVLDLETVQLLVSDLTAVENTDATPVDGMDAIICETDAGAALYGLPDFNKIMDVDIKDNSRGNSQWCENGFLFLDSFGWNTHPLYNLQGTLIGSTGYRTYLIENENKDGFIALLTGETITNPQQRMDYNNQITSFVYITYGSSSYLKGAIETLNGTQLLPEEYDEVIGSESFICAYAMDAKTLSVYRIVRA